MATTNPNFYGQSNTDTSNHIEDGVDYPHTGLVKALSLGMANTYAISGFNASSVTATAITIANGVIIRNGERVAVTGATLAIADTHTDTTAGEAGYNLLVAPAGASPTVVIRGSAAANKVPAYTDGDTIIAVLTHTGTNPMHIQYLTLNHKTNSLSIAYNDSGYTESMKITGDTDKTSFQSMEQDSDIRFILGHNTSAEKFEIMTDDGGDGDLSPVNEVFSVDGTGVTAVKSLSLGTAGELTVTETSDDITFANTVDDKTIKFTVKDDGSAVRTATFTAVTDSNHLQLKGIEETFIIAASDETTDLTTGDGKATFAAPFNMLITGVKASVTTTPAGSNITVAIRRLRAGAATVEVLSTNITIEPNEETSRTATSAPAINTSNDDINIDDIIAIDIDGVGSSRAGKGLKVTIFAYRT